MYKYGITPQELKEARKLIIQDIRSNNKVVKPIENMTLQMYFDIIKECMLGATDENGVVVDPWGNTWTMLGGIMVYGNTVSNGGVPYICSDYNYSYNGLGNNYESAEFSLPNENGWVAALGYGSKKYDWLLMPAAANGGANSILPVGDNGWFDSNLTGYRAVVHGGGWSFGESDGPFYYACDHAPTDTQYRSYGSRLMFVPTKNNIYTANIAKWQREMNIGG